MAVPQRQSIDQEFRNENYDPNSLGVRNAVVTQKTTGVERDKTANILNRPKKRYQNEEINRYTEPTDVANSNYAPPNPSVSPRKRNRRGFVAETITVNVARVRAVPVAVTISVWALPFYFFIMLPLSVMALAAFGMAVAVEYFTGTTGGGIAEAIYKQVTGLDFSAFMVVYFALSGIICFFNWIQIIVGSAMFKMAFIKPWFGVGTAFKTGSIILIFISSFVPVLQMFPLVGLWVFAVVTNPK